MAENEAQPAVHYDEHEKTYQMFLRLIKYSIAGVAILALMACLWG
jgi:aa3 type cytochrome c oxidase subunit IV